MINRKRLKNEKEEQLYISENFTYRGVGFMRWEFRKHTYIIFKNYNQCTMVHDPDCPCQELNMNTLMGSFSSRTHKT